MKYKYKSTGRGLDSFKIDGRALLKRLVSRFHLMFGRFYSLKRINAERVRRLVFVCRGNVCRSPYAEAAARSLGLSAISCGIDVSRSDPAEAMAVRAALLCGEDIRLHMSRSIYDVSLESSDCLVVMDPSHLPVARNLSSRVGCQITLLGLWLKPAVAEIEDPYGKPLHVFSRCFDKIEKALVGLADGLPALGKNVTAVIQSNIKPDKAG